MAIGLVLYVGVRTGLFLTGELPSTSTSRADHDRRPAGERLRCRLGLWERRALLWWCALF